MLASRCLRVVASRRLIQVVALKPVVAPSFGKVLKPNGPRHQVIRFFSSETNEAKEAKEAKEEDVTEEKAQKAAKEDDDHDDHNDHDAFKVDEDEDPLAERAPRAGSTISIASAKNLAAKLAALRSKSPEELKASYEKLKAQEEPLTAPQVVTLLLDTNLTPEIAAGLYELAESKGLKNEYIYHAYVSFLAKQRQVKLAHSVLKKSIEAGVEGQSRIYYDMLEACVAAKEHELFDELLEEMKTRNPPLQHDHSVFTWAVRNGIAKNDADYAEKWFKEAEAEHKPVHVRCFSELFKFHRDNGRLERAEEVLRIMRVKGPPYHDALDELGADYIKAGKADHGNKLKEEAAQARADWHKATQVRPRGGAGEGARGDARGTPFNSSSTRLVDGNRNASRPPRSNNFNNSNQQQQSGRFGQQQQQQSPRPPRDNQQYQRDNQQYQQQQQQSRPNQQQYPQQRSPQGQQGSPPPPPQQQQQWQSTPQQQPWQQPQQQQQQQQWTPPQFKPTPTPSAYPPPPYPTAAAPQYASSPFGAPPPASPYGTWPPVQSPYPYPVSATPFAAPPAGTPFAAPPSGTPFAAVSSGTPYATAYARPPVAPYSATPQPSPFPSSSAPPPPGAPIPPGGPRGYGQ